MAGSLAAANVPLVIFAASSDGTSAATIDRNDGAPLDPFGLAKKRFADCDASTAVRVPVPVTGEPETVNIAGSDRPTLRTVAVPPPSC
jgi:hypothetical protein